MLTFEYTARDPVSGNEVKAEVTAENESAASKLIAQQGYAPLDIHLKGKKRNWLSRKKKISAKEKVLFSRQLSTLINAGLPLTQSLRTVVDQMTNREFVVIINKLTTDIESGSTFAKALARHPLVFNNVFVSLVAAGEASGTLDEALERLADQQEKDAEVVSKVRGAMIYPSLVLVVIFGVIGFMLVTVLPQVEQLYADLDQKLPFITTALLGLSRVLTTYWWAIILLLIGGIWGLRQYIRTPKGRLALDRFKMRVPLFGKMFMKMYMARFTRTGQTLLASGVPMLEMMRITAGAVNNTHIATSLRKASEQVKAGVALSESISKDPNFLPLVPQMIRIGEQSGSIDTMLGKAATFYENELNNEIKAISTVIEPALMIVLALVAGVVVVAILLPIYGLVGSNLTG